VNFSVRHGWIALAVLLALVLAALAGLRLANQRLEAVLQEALGPRASIGRVSLGWHGLELRDLQLRAAPAGWPASDELRAARVRLSPSLASLWSGHWKIRRVELEQGYL
jgi:uncharacterized protein YhdP